MDTNDDERLANLNELEQIKHHWEGKKKKFFHDQICSIYREK